ncbi:MAG: c-type cytochrome domain-containing protein, partial [Planctomycetaceae bacterium]
MTAYWRQPDQCFRLINTAAMIGATVFVAAVTGSTAVCGDVDFVREIRPILAEKCFACHGPDEQTRQVGLRFDVRTAATGQLQSGSIAIVPGDPTTSELIRRIDSSDPDQLMPPPEHEKPLTAAERDILQRWISEGAEYQQHWSFQPVQVPEVPASTFDSWDRNRIDHFVGRRLRDAGFDPSPEADKTALIRRLSFDLRGLPPTVAEVDAFLADQSADA